MTVTLIPNVCGFVQWIFHRQNHRPSKFGGVINAALADAAAACLRLGGG